MLYNLQLKNKFGSRYYNPTDYFHNSSYRVAVLRKISYYIWYENSINQGISITKNSKAERGKYSSHKPMGINPVFFTLNIL